MPLLFSIQVLTCFLLWMFAGSTVHVSALTTCKDTARWCSESNYCDRPDNNILELCMLTCQYCTSGNVAYGKPTNQSSDYDIGYESIHAVDGKRETGVDAKCTLTDDTDTDSWWCVDLMNSYNVSKMDIYTDELEAGGFSVRLSEHGQCDQTTFESASVCYNDRHLESDSMYSLTSCNEGETKFEGRLVFINTIEKQTPVDLCEVEIYSAYCSPGFYESGDVCRPCNCNGNTCNPTTGACVISCSPNCINNRCDVAGNCLDGCHTGYYGNRCDLTCSSSCKDKTCDSSSGDCLECNGAFYGKRCDKNCPNCKNSVCSITNGVCLYGCKEGFHGSAGLCGLTCPNCKPGGCYVQNGICINGCIDGFYGPGGLCGLECPNCLPGGCAKTSGECNNGCKDGFYGNRCESPCPACTSGRCNRKTGSCIDGCPTGFYGKTCQKNCSNCLGGLYGCNKKGKCNNGCKDGFYGSGGKCGKECKQCLPGGCEEKTGACIEGCPVGFYGSRCTFRCNASCENGCAREYGDCLDCTRGRFGTHCQQNCSKGCLENSCSREDGSCSCQRGFYGDRCDRECSDTCLNKTCEIPPGAVEPICTEGCVDGYSGSHCQDKCPANCERCPGGTCTSCSLGYYGEICNKGCPVTCGNGCDKMSGTCSSCGLNCAEDCNEDGSCGKCKDGFYGDFCNEACSTDCLNSICMKSGSSIRCTEGCINGKTGEDCSDDCLPHCISCRQSNKLYCTACEEGWRGQYCYYECSSYISKNCKTCHQTEYRCLSCNPGWYGKYCRDKCFDGCLNTVCDIDGSCSNCTPGYFGRRCEKTCPEGCLGGECNTDGTCHGCMTGLFGENCEQTCPLQCLKGKCNLDGVCSDGCKDCRYGEKCEKICSTGCKVTDGFTRCEYRSGKCIDGCVAGKKGDNCSEGQICYEFGCHYTSHCDGDYENSTGVCYGKCTAGWYGPTCQLENVALGKPVYQNIPYTSNWRTGNIVDGNTSLDVCVDKAGLQGMDVFVEIDMKAVYTVKNVTIYYRPDGRDSLQGFSVGTTMIPDGDATNCYQHQLNEAIPSVINLECSVTGRYLYIKNSRSAPPYPQDYGLAAELELCEVLVFACAKGTFGERCENMCHCHDDANCDDQTGHCPESPSSVCEIGWTGERCDTECISTYGVNCSQKCEDRHCAGVTTCNPVNGSCDQGCEDEYMGVDCSYIAAKKCISTYGVNCSQKCEDRHCAGVTTCNPVNGSCDQGCEDEYMGVDCSYSAPKGSLQVGHADDGLSKVTVGLTGVVCGCTFSLFIAFVVFKCCFKCRQRRKFSLSATRNRDTDIYASVYDSINDVNQPSGAVSNRTYGAGGRDETTTRTSGGGRALPDIVVDDSLRSGTTPAEAPYIDMNKNSIANTASTPVQTQSANQYEDINDMKRGVTLNLRSGVEGCEYYTMDKNNKQVPKTQESDNSREVTPNLQSDGAVCEYQTMKLDNVGYQNDELVSGSHETNSTTVQNPNFPPEEDGSKYHNMKIRNVVYENDKPMVEASDSKVVSPSTPTVVSCEYQTMKLDNAGYDNDKQTSEVSGPDGVEEANSNFPSDPATCIHQDMNLENLGFENDEEIANDIGDITPNNQSDVSGCENHDYSVDGVLYYNEEQMIDDGRLPADQEDSEHKILPRKDGALPADASMDNGTRDPELQNN